MYIHGRRSTRRVNRSTYIYIYIPANTILSDDERTEHGDHVQRSLTMKQFIGHVDTHRELLPCTLTHNPRTRMCSRDKDALAVVLGGRLIIRISKIIFSYDAFTSGGVRCVIKLGMPRRRSHETFDAARAKCSISTMRSVA